MRGRLKGGFPKWRTGLFFVIRELTAREIKRKYARSSLGIIWSVLQPLLNMVVISLVFSTMFQRDIKNFPIYYLTGQIMWGMFSNSTNTSMSALVDNKNLLIRTKLSKTTFIYSRIYTAFVNFGYTLIAYIPMLIIFRIRFTPAMILFFVAAMFELIFCIGLSFILATMYVFFADIKYLYGVLLQLLMYLSAIFYPVTRLPEYMQIFIGEMPTYQWISFARICVMEGQVPEIGIWIRMMAWAFISLMVGMIVFRINENKVMQVV